MAMSFDTRSPFQRSVNALADRLRERPAIVLSGAGCSTESGIPDYRSPGRPARTPMRHGEFMGSAEARARYWARSAVGWERFSQARPNEAHRAIAEMEKSGVVQGVITQNVDGLHQAAGSRRVVELHGSVSKVRCMACGQVEDRGTVQARIRESNPAFGWEAAQIAPDGDAEIHPSADHGFVVPDCPVCGGIVKPDVVFFGANVSRTILDEAWRLFDEGQLLLVAGSSLTVFSGRRFVLRAAERGIPVVILNSGPTRGDEVAELRVEGRLGEVLPILLHALAPSGPMAARR